MDIFIPYLFLLLLLPLFMHLFFREEASDGPENLPPGSDGWPILGENIAVAFSGMPKFVSDRMGRYSRDVFKTSLLGEKVMVFCGAQGNKFVFTGDGKLFSPWLPLSMKKVLLPDFVDTGYEETAVVYRSFFHDTLKYESVREHVPVMDAMARHQLRRHWRPNPLVKALPLVDRYTFELACRLFMKVVDEERVGKMMDLFAGMRKGMLTLPVDLPGTAFRRAIKAGERLREEVTRVVAERRKEGAGEGDLLSKILLMTDEDASDEMLGKFFVSLMFASHETTSNTLVSILYFLATLPHVYQRVFEEQMAIAKSKGDGENMTWEDVEKMTYSWNVAREVLRLAPPGPRVFREATTDISYAGFTIYKGMKAFWTPYSSHTNPDFFPEPEKFDPSRFEGSGPAPYTFVPFGGGIRMCPGRVYAKLAILVFMHNMVTSFKFEKAIPNEKLVVNFLPKPTHGLHLRLYPHNTK